MHLIWAGLGEGKLSIKIMTMIDISLQVQCFISLQPDNYRQLFPATSLFLNLTVSTASHLPKLEFGSVTPVWSPPISSDFLCVSFHLFRSDLSCCQILQTYLLLLLWSGSVLICVLNMSDYFQAFSFLSKCSSHPFVYIMLAVLWNEPTTQAKMEGFLQCASVIKLATLLNDVVSWNEMANLKFLLMWSFFLNCFMCFGARIITSMALLCQAVTLPLI